MCQPNRRAECIEMAADLWTPPAASLHGCPVLTSHVAVDGFVVDVACCTVIAGDGRRTNTNATTTTTRTASWGGGRPVLLSAAIVDVACSAAAAEVYGAVESAKPHLERRRDVVVYATTMPNLREDACGEVVVDDTSIHHDERTRDAAAEVVRIPQCGSSTQCLQPVRVLCTPCSGGTVGVVVVLSATTSSTTTTTTCTSSIRSCTALAAYHYSLRLYEYPCSRDVMTMTATTSLPCLATLTVTTTPLPKGPKAVMFAIPPRSCRLDQGSSGIVIGFVTLERSESSLPSEASVLLRVRMWAIAIDREVTTAHSSAAGGSASATAHVQELPAFTEDISTLFDTHLQQSRSIIESTPEWSSFTSSGLWSGLLHVPLIDETGGATNAASRQPLLTVSVRLPPPCTTVGGDAACMCQRGGDGGCGALLPVVVVSPGSPDVSSDRPAADGSLEGEGPLPIALPARMLLHTTNGQDCVMVGRERGGHRRWIAAKVALDDVHGLTLFDPREPTTCFRRHACSAADITRNNAKRRVVSFRKVTLPIVAMRLATFTPSCYVQRQLVEASEDAGAQGIGVGAGGVNGVSVGVLIRVVFHALK